MNAPVEELYASGVVALKLVDDILLLNVDQSLEVRTPLFVADALGRLNVIVLPVPVTVKSEPFVEVAKVTAGPVVVCPTGPSDVSAAVRPWVRQITL